MGRVSHADLWGTYAQAEQQLRKPSGTSLTPAKVVRDASPPTVLVAATAGAARQTGLSPKSTPNTSPGAARKA